MAVLLIVVTMLAMTMVSVDHAVAGPALSNHESSDLYYLVFLRPNPNRTKLSKADGERIQSAHMANIHRMAEDGVLVAAGPFEDTPTTISGIFTFKTSSLERAKEIAALDPTVQAQRNIVDVHPWQGPKGIGAEYFRLHKEDPTTPDHLRVHPLCLVFRAAGDAGVRKHDSVLDAHEQFVERLRMQKKLSATGTVDEDDLVEVLIFNSIPLEEVQELLAQDPAVQSGAFRLEMHRWWSADHVLPQ